MKQVEEKLKNVEFSFDENASNEAEKAEKQRTENEAQKARFQSEEYQQEAREALVRINTEKARAVDKAICKNAGLL